MVMVIIVTRKVMILLITFDAIGLIDKRDNMMNDLDYLLMIMIMNYFLIASIKSLEDQPFH